MGRVVVIGGVAPQDRPTTTLTEEAVLVGGRERTVAEFRELAREAGLDVVVAERSPAGTFVVECRTGEVVCEDRGMANDGGSTHGDGQRPLHRD
jgi:NADPH-dependent ferric siderophore reductase